MKVVKLYRVKMSEAGMLPKGFPEGMITGFTPKEMETLMKNPALAECFEPILIQTQEIKNADKRERDPEPRAVAGNVEDRSINADAQDVAPEQHAVEGDPKG